ncbi:hypothetical protein F5884DRAFT_772660 [Xylogone sp. PMI_703]|nr:hypothetical protein F5884DRAFT_772660 [Xylogone sp. PMI_703]
MTRNYKHLTPEQVESFMKHGFLRIEGCFTPEKAAQWTSTVWTRLGMDPADKSTWTQERINMPSHSTEEVKSFAPKVWDAMCEILGGEERIAQESAVWNDGLIVNLGSPEFEGKFPSPRELPGWHVDGDFFMHYLDSREQALLVIPLFTDIKEHAGGTLICSDAIPVIAKHLYEHPEGVSPRMVPRGEEPKYEDLGFYIDVVQHCNEFHEMTGKLGDVILMHPLMVHSASRNSLRIPRIITNPPVSLVEPFNFNRENPDDYSLVELKTLQALGKDSLPGWKATGPRESVVPERLKRQNEMKRLELERLEKLKNSQAVMV